MSILKVESIREPYNNTEAMFIDSSGDVTFSGSIVIPGTISGVNLATLNTTVSTLATDLTSLNTTVGNIVGLPDAIDVDASAPADSVNIDASGNVGIGTSSPSSPLTINRSIDGDCIEFETSGTIVGKISTDSGRALVFDADPVPGGSVATTMRFNVDNSEAMRIDSSGNVGIGTDDPTTKLCVSANASQNIEISGSWIQSFNRSNPGYASMPFYADNFIFTGSTEKMRITSSGNVGIGTNSPTEYSGQTNLNINSTGVSRIDFDISNSLQGYALAESGYMGLYANTGKTLRLGANNTEAMRIDDNGTTVQYSGYQTSHSNSTGTLLLNLASLGYGGNGQAEIWITASENNYNRGFAKYMVIWGTKNSSPYYWYSDLQEIGRVNINNNYGNPYVYLENQSSNYTGINQSMTSATGNNAFNIYVRTDAPYSGTIRVFFKLFQNA